MHMNFRVHISSFGYKSPQILIMKGDNMFKSYSMELGGRTLTVDVGRVAKQANGAALMHYGDTTVLCTRVLAWNLPEEHLR